MDESKLFRAEEIAEELEGLPWWAFIRREDLRRELAVLEGRADPVVQVPAGHYRVVNPSPAIAFAFDLDPLLAEERETGYRPDFADVIWYYDPNELWYHAANGVPVSRYGRSSA